MEAHEVVAVCGLRQTHRKRAARFDDLGVSLTGCANDGESVNIFSHCVGISKKPPTRSREGARQTIASCTARCGQVLTCFGAQAKRFRGGGSSRARFVEELDVCSVGQA